MSFDILTAIDKLCELQRKLEITQPIKAKIRGAYPGPVDSNKLPNERPCFVNTYELQPTRFSSALLTRVYEVNMQLLVSNASLATAYRIAYAFEEQLIRGLAHSVTLGGAVTKLDNIRGSVRMSAWAGVVALDYFVLLTMSEDQEYYP